MPDMTGIFRLMSDTSTLAAGAALYQYQGSAFYIVGYNSKKLPNVMCGYTPLTIRETETLTNNGLYI